MSIAENITREDFSYGGGGVELDLTAFGYEGEFLSAYQNYLGGGMLGSVAIAALLRTGGWMRSLSDSRKGLVSTTKSGWMSWSISMSITRRLSGDQ